MRYEKQSMTTKSMHSNHPISTATVLWASIAGIITLLVLDIIWVRFVMLQRYASLVQSIQGSPMVPSVPYTLLAYLVMCIVHAWFLNPAYRGYWVMLDGAVLGASLYGVYNFTCGAIFAQWQSSLAALDILWGASVYAVSAGVSAWVYSTYSTR